MVDRTMERKSIDEALLSISAYKDEAGLVPLTTSPQVIVGPRGVGKTVLLQLMLERAFESGIHAVELDKTVLTGPVENLKRTITPPSRLDKFFGFLKRSKGAARLSEMFDFEVGPSGKLVPEDLKATMVAGSLAGPMAIFLDEAHTVPPDRMRVFCDAAQNLMAIRYPLLLVLAGTPGLLSLLMNMGGTFMERAKRLRFNLFTAEETKEALSKGFEGTGVRIENDALGCLADWSDHYPYFIQLAGHWTWKQAKESGAKVVDLKLVNASLKLANEDREFFHQTRRTELLDHGVLNQAIQVAEMMADSPDGVDRAEFLGGLLCANQGLDEDGAKEIEQKLINLGFLFEGQDRLEPGIPSLFDHVKSKPRMEYRDT